MKRYLPVFLLALVCGISFTSCSQMQQQQSEKQTKDEALPEIPPPLYLGTVHQVFSSDKFALLRIIGPQPKEGTVLIAHPADGTADRVGNLIVSSAQHARNNIIAADIRAGVVMKGDRVFRYRSIAAAPIQEEEPEPFTMSGTEIDLGYTPPAIKEKVQQTQSEQFGPEPSPIVSEDDSDLPGSETTVLPTAESVAPAVPEITPHGRFDDIPDNINDWDSM